MARIPKVKVTLPKAVKNQIVSDHHSSIGAKGGAVRSPKKVAAARRNLNSGRSKRWPGSTLYNEVKQARSVPEVPPAMNKLLKGEKV